MDKQIEDIKGIADISGFGKNTGYEKSCQDMLQAGWEWMNNKETEPYLEGHTYKNIYGIFEADSPDAKELSKVIVAAAKGDCTGAMHQAVMSHLLYISKQGIDAWKKAALTGEGK